MSSVALQLYAWLQPLVPLHRRSLTLRPNNDANVGHVVFQSHSRMADDGYFTRCDVSLTITIVCVRAVASNTVCYHAKMMYWRQQDGGLDYLSNAHNPNSSSLLRPVDTYDT